MHKESDIGKAGRMDVHSTGGSGSSIVNLEARTELELRSYDTLEREARGSLVNRAFNPHWGRESTGCQNAGATGTRHRARSDR
jgi:hypothetical protein